MSIAPQLQTLANNLALADQIMGIDTIRPEERWLYSMRRQNVKVVSVVDPFHEGVSKFGYDFLTEVPRQMQLPPIPAMSREGSGILQSRRLYARQPPPRRFDFIRNMFSTRNRIRPAE